MLRPDILRFMADRAARRGTLAAPPAVIPPAQMQRLMFMLGQADVPVEFTQQTLSAGDTVRVVRGRLQGLTGQIIQTSDSSHAIVVSLGLLGGAMVKIDPTDVEKLTV